MIVESYEDVIHLSGGLNENFWETVHTAISLTLKRHPTGVIIDASGITECTPEGAETFRDVLFYIQEHDTRLIVVGVPDNVMEVIKATPEVRSQLPIAKSIEEARHSLDLLVHETDPKKKPQQLEERPKVVLYLTGDERDEHGLSAGKRMVDGIRGELILTFVIVVPRELPLQAPMHECEEKAVEAIRKAEEFLKLANVPYTVALEHGRDVASALENVMEEQKAAFLLIPLDSNPDRIDEELKLVKLAMTNVSSPVAFIRGKVKR